MRFLLASAALIFGVACTSAPSPSILDAGLPRVPLARGEYPLEGEVVGGSSGARELRIDAFVNPICVTATRLEVVETERSVGYLPIGRDKPYEPSGKPLICVGGNDRVRFTEKLDNPIGDRAVVRLKADP